MDAKYRGPCCGGTRQAGDGNPSTCIKCGTFKAYLCGMCRRPLTLTEEQKARIARNKDKAIEQGLGSNIRTEFPG